MNTPEWMGRKKVKLGQRVIVALRNMIANGQIEAGQRIAEIPTAELLGVSRMPVRTALRALEQEGLVVKLGARGYAARSFSRDDLRDSVEVRGVLEGLAAAQVTSRGISAQEAKILRDCLAKGDALFAKGELVPDDIDRYHSMNHIFHTAIIRASGNRAIEMALARNNSMPFGGASAIALDETNLAGEYRRLFEAHQQHHRVYEAIMGGQSAEADAIMRLHAAAALAGPATDKINGSLLAD